MSGSPVPLSQIVLKVHSPCDLACDHCYVYEAADQSWRGRPMVISDGVTSRTAREGAELFETEAAVSRKSECADNDSAIQVILRMAELLQDAPVHDLLICSPAGFHAVLTASSAYYSQETSELLRAGEFRIVGKVSRIVTGESTIDLTRRMSLAAAQPVVTRELLAAARAAGLPIGFADSVVRAPAVQVIPMAVFL